MPASLFIYTHRALFYVNAQYRTKKPIKQNVNRGFGSPQMVYV